MNSVTPALIKTEKGANAEKKYSMKLKKGIPYLVKACYVKPFYVLFFCFTFFLLQFSLAQSFTGAIHAGVSATQVAGDGLSGYHKAGIIAGGSVYTKLSEKFVAEMEIQYIQKGSKTKLDSLNYYYYKMSLAYIEVPILIQYNYSRRFQFYAGISIGQLIASKEEDFGGEIPNTLEFEKNDFSFFGGFNFGFSEKFLAVFRLSNSFLPIRRVGADTPLLQNIISGQYNTVIELKLKYRLLKAAD